MNDFIKQKIEEFQQRMRQPNKSDDEWISLYEEFHKFISDNHLSANDLKSFCDSGDGERLSMIYKGIMFERGIVIE